MFISGLEDDVSDEDLQEYFGQFGDVANVVQMTDKSTGRKSGFGSVEFDNYDTVIKLMLKGKLDKLYWLAKMKNLICSNKNRYLSHSQWAQHWNQVGNTQ